MDINAIQINLVYSKELDILLNDTFTLVHIDLDSLLYLKDKIEKSIDFAKNNDIKKLNNDIYEDYIKQIKYSNSPKKDKTPKPTKIYVMIDKNTGYYKIGRSKKPLVRESTLQSEKPTIELLFYFDATERLEKEIHIVFEHKRIRGEWFDLTEEDVLQIKKIAELL